MLGIRRRDFIILLGGAAAWPLAARAQQRTLPTVGLLFSGTPETNGDEVTALRRGMSETGFVEGRNVAVEYRWGAPLSALDLAAADLVNRRVTVIAANTAGAALRAKAATASIPIVFVAFADAVKVGLVTNLGRPDGNLTGINLMVAALGAKRFELLGELVPRALRFGVLVNPAVPAFEADIDFARAATKTIRQHMTHRERSQLNAALDEQLATIDHERVDPLLDSSCKCRIYLAIGAGGEDLQ